jgi:hypothetical protein
VLPLASGTCESWCNQWSVRFLPCHFADAPAPCSMLQLTPSLPVVNRTCAQTECDTCTNVRCLAEVSKMCNIADHHPCNACVPSDPSQSNSGGAAPCDTIAANGHCEAYCNDYTCEDQMCKGCAQCDAYEISHRCQAWCNVHTCTDTVNCPGCAICTSGSSTWCEGWCNVHTCNSEFCHGCDGGSGRPDYGC